ncbi:hypothetical protein HYW83_03510 [Candidatus Peregrinibacteria bacterium]|nr:hypothetical protein [Candidatus Peregrinibacteria bacterium]
MSLAKICEVGNHPFELTTEDIAAYQKFGFEPLPICFPHQHQWRLAFRNDRFLHRRKCDLTGASIISMYPPDTPYPVYEREAWFSDKWDPFSYGRDFDFNKPFFEQFAELQKVVPRCSLFQANCVNSEYCNCTMYDKNCYLIFGGDFNEDCMYGSLPMHCKDSVDCDWTEQCQLCYFCAYSENCYGCRFTFRSKGCSDCAFIEDCIGCTECILSTNLRNKSFYIENKPYSKQEYFSKKAELLNGSFEQQTKMLKRFMELRQRRPVKFANILNGENVTGDIIFNSKNCRNCYECIDSEDCLQCYTIFNAKDCFNADYDGHRGTLNFNNVACGTAYRTWFSRFTIEASDIEYCEHTNFSKNLFGCIALRHKQYCILNKQYTKETFEKLRLAIIEHMKKTNEWGRYFPKTLSLFPYNQTTASFFFPRTREQALAEGFIWKNEEAHDFMPQIYKIPDSIQDVTDGILNETLACEATGKNFRIIPQEFKFYRQQNIPIPRRHPDTRYGDRLALRNPFKIFERKCERCNASVQTTYAPERTETIYCEKCYLESVY